MKFELYISEKDIQKRVKELAVEISNECKIYEPTFVGVLNGSFYFLSDLLQNIFIHYKLDFISIDSYKGMQSTKNIRFNKWIKDTTEDNIILVEDIIDSGLTMTKIIDRFNNQGFENIRICTLLDKPKRRLPEAKHLKINYCGFEIEDDFVVGYGLDYNEQFRWLKHIYKITL